MLSSMYLVHTITIVFCLTNCIAKQRRHRSWSRCFILAKGSLKNYGCLPTQGKMIAYWLHYEIFVKLFRMINLMLSFNWCSTYCSDLFIVYTYTCKQVDTVVLSYIKIETLIDKKIRVYFLLATKNESPSRYCFRSISWFSNRLLCFQTSFKS
jgi:hypothetical protein